jgi:hypothetical protein
VCCALWSTTLAAQPKPTPKAAPKAAKHSWPNEPDSFHGARFGGSEADTRGQFSSNELGPSKTDDANLQKLTDIALGLAGTSIDGRLIYHDGKFVGVVGLFPAEKFPVVEGVFVERYGKALAHQMGVHSWPGKAVSLMLRENATAEDRDWVQRVAEIRWDDKLKRASDGQKQIDQMILDEFARASNQAIEQVRAGGSLLTIRGKHKKGRRDFQEARG